MIIKQLTLENIRSHKSTKIEFAEGKTLIRGDIGSGKSGIMMSIEAALFGKKLKQLMWMKLIKWSKIKIVILLI